MKNKSVNTASFYYSLNMLKLLQDMNLVTEDEVAKIKKSLSEHYGVTDIYNIKRHLQCCADIEQEKSMCQKEQRESHFNANYLLSGMR